MANPDRAFGLKPVKYMNGSPYNGKVKVYYKSGGNAIYKGSPVKLGGSADTSGKTPSIDIYDTSNPVLGVAISFSTVKQLRADPTDLERDYCPASTGMYIGVVDDPSVLFEVQEDNGGSAHVEAADVGQMFALENGNAGSTTTGLSTAELDSDGDAADTGSHDAQFQLMGVVDREDNEMGSSADHTKYLVRIADHALAVQNDAGLLGA